MNDDSGSCAPWNLLPSSQDPPSDAEACSELIPAIAQRGDSRPSFDIHNSRCKRQLLGMQIMNLQKNCRSSRFVALFCQYPQPQYKKVSAPLYRDATALGKYWTDVRWHYQNCRC